MFRRLCGARELLREEEPLSVEQVAEEVAISPFHFIRRFQDRPGAPDEATYTCFVTGAAKRIEIRADVMLGKPVIRGTRIPVELLLRRISERASEGDLLASYPNLKREDTRASVAYAAELREHRGREPDSGLRGAGLRWRGNLAIRRRMAR